MFYHRVVAFLFMCNLTCIWNPMAVAKIFEKTRYPNGTVTCALDEPSLVIHLDQLSPSLSDRDSCVAPGALCAMQCVQDPDCTNYNYRAYPRTCELYHYTPTNCSPMTGCYHAEVTDLQSCQSPLEERSTISAVTDDWSQDHSVLSSKESTDMLVITMGTKDTATAANSAPPTNELNYCLSSTFAIVSNSMSSTKSLTTSIPKPSTTSLEVSSSTSSTTSLEISSSTSSTESLEVSSYTSSTTVLSTSTTFQVVESTTTSTITIVPPPTIDLGNPCDKFLSTPNYVAQVNQGFGLDQRWQAFKYGFSDANGGYWLGNENLYRMTNNGQKWNLCADVQDSLGVQYYVSYSTFIMDSESVGYTYFVNGMQGTATDPMGPDSRKYKFTTKDKNNQPCCCTNQATACKGGWWWICNDQNMAVLNGAGSCGFKYGLGFGPTMTVKRSYIRISQQ